MHVQDLHAHCRCCCCRRIAACHTLPCQAAEASLADSWVRGGCLLGLQRRLLRLGRPPRRWRRPAWAPAAEWEPPEHVITGRPLNKTTGTKSKCARLRHRLRCQAAHAAAHAHHNLPAAAPRLLPKCTWPLLTMLLLLLLHPLASCACCRARRARFYGADDSQVTVEELALQHYASREGGGWLGAHTEGGVWATLFALLLWDVLFAGAPCSERPRRTRRPCRRCCMQPLLCCAAAARLLPSSGCHARNRRLTLAAAPPRRRAASCPALPPCRPARRA